MGLAVFRRFIRPFTLVPPGVGVLCWGLTATGADPKLALDLATVWPLLLGGLMAASLNVASNGINQIYDLEIDRINKPERPLPAGELSLRQAWNITLVAYALALGLAWVIVPASADPETRARHETFWVVLLGALFTYIYSAPPLRTKRLTFLSNLTMAVPRGTLLIIAGWSAARSVLAPEPWFVALTFGVYVLGAATTKDFADIEGDRQGGCMTLPVRFGVRRSAWMITPFLCLPFLAIPIGVGRGILTGPALPIALIGFGLCLYGAYIAYLILRNPEELATESNHISWKHMYLLMVVAQVSFAVFYLFG
jgi:4-hydroxybenzoate polyprenyltransferase